MRCTQCNIDVAQDALRCPLCGSETQDTAPLLPELSAPPYPKVNYRPYPKNKNRILLVLGALLCAGAVAVDGLVASRPHWTVVAITASLSFWALLARPRTKQQLHFGDYALLNATYLSLLSVALCWAFLQKWSVAFCAPILCIAAIALLVNSLRKKNPLFDLRYVLLLIAMNAVLLICAGVIDDPLCAEWGSMTAALVCMLFLCLKDKDNAIDAFRAVFTLK